jgi:Frizzled/Smoothened family membrane region
MYAAAHLVRAVAGRDVTSCDSSSSSLVHGDIRNACCVVVAVLLHYFGTAGAIWWAMLTISWYLAAARKVRIFLKFLENTSRRYSLISLKFGLQKYSEGFISSKSFKASFLAILTDCCRISRTCLLLANQQPTKVSVTCGKEPLNELTAILECWCTWRVCACAAVISISLFHKNCEKIKEQLQQYRQKYTYKANKAAIGLSIETEQ